jgi:adenylylsulfate reductase, subunit A
MMTVEGLFGAGDTIGGTAHKFSSGSFTEGRIAAKAAVKYVQDMGSQHPQVSEAEYEDLKKTIYQPLETYAVGRNEIVAGTVSPSYLLPIQGLQRLEKIMDEYGDLGQPANPIHTDGLLAFYKGLMALGISEADIVQMSQTNPAKLLGLKP